MAQIGSNNNNSSESPSPPCTPAADDDHCHQPYNNNNYFINNNNNINGNTNNNTTDNNDTSGIIFNSIYGNVERLARDWGTENIDDVNAATAMLALKHGPKVFTENYHNR